MSEMRYGSSERPAETFSRSLRKANAPARHAIGVWNRHRTGRKGHETEAFGFGPVRRSYLLLQHCAEYFRETGIPLSRLAALSAAGRLVRFLAYMLPFKALMFMVSGRVIHISGNPVAPTETAGIILVAAVALFLLQLLLTRLYNSRIGAVFGEAAIDDAVEELMHHGDEVRVALQSTVNLRAAASLGFVLLSANFILFSPSLIMILPVMSYALFVIYAMSRPGYDKALVPGKYSSIVNFVAMIFVLLLLGGTVFLGTEVHFVLALFVFISFRYITNCMTEIGAILYRYRLGVMPAFLRSRIGDPTETDFKVASGPPPFLSAAKKNDWIRSALAQFDVRPDKTVDAVWNHSGGTQSFGFIMSFADSAPVLMNIFQPSGKSAFLQEQAVGADFEGAPFMLGKLGQSKKGQFSVIGYDLRDTESVKYDEFQAARQTLTMEMLKTRPPQFPRMKTSGGDKLRWLTRESLDTLRAVSPDMNAISLVDWLEVNGPALRKRIAALPLALHVPSIQSSLVRRHSDGTIKLMSWNDADIEPIGGGLGPVEVRRNLSVSDLVSEIKAHRADCANLSVEDVEISAHLFTLARYVKRRDWSKIYSAIEGLRDVAEAR